MEHFHLVGEKLFQPLVLFYVVLYELDSQLTINLDGTFSTLLSVEPCLCPPHDAVFVGIDADGALYVKALYVNVEVLKRVDDTLTRYGVVKSFFLSFSLIAERNTPCMRAR